MHNSNPIKNEFTIFCEKFPSMNYFLLTFTHLILKSLANFTIIFFLKFTLFENLVFLSVTQSARIFFLPIYWKLFVRLK